MADLDSMTDTERAIERLNDILFAGLVGDIYLAERARQLHRSVAEHTAAISQAELDTWDVKPGIR